MLSPASPPGHATRLLVNDLGRHVAPIGHVVRGAMDRVLRSHWFVLGPEVKGFEGHFAEYCQVDHCVGVASGTDALELALRAVGVAPGSGVITVANAGGYSTVAIRAIGANPMYVDVNADTLLIDLDLLENALTNTTASAVVATHLYGAPLDMTALTAMAERAGVPVVEDCAQAHGATWQGRRCGSFGAAGAFSFYPTKNLGAIGDGGAVVTDDPDVAQRLRALRQYGWSDKYVVVAGGGVNSRLDELQAAVLADLLPHLDAWNARRRNIVRRYSTEIRHGRVQHLLRTSPGDVGHLFVLRTDARHQLREHLAALGIGTDVHYPLPDHRQPAFAGTTSPTLPVSEAAAREITTLPCFPEMTDVEVTAVVEAVNSWPVALP